jgi:hypothetical protein
MTDYRSPRRLSAPALCPNSANVYYLRIESFWRREAELGKAAENERLKLKATFLNNLGVSSIVTGFIIPYIAYRPPIVEPFDYSKSLLANVGARLLTYENIVGIVTLLSSIFLGCLMAWFFRKFANDIVSQIKD